MKNLGIGDEGVRDLERLGPRTGGCYVLSCFSHVQLFVTLWTVAHQAPLSKGFSRQGYWSGLPCPPPENLPDPGMEPKSLMFPALAGEFFTTSVLRKPKIDIKVTTKSVRSIMACDTF